MKKFIKKALAAALTFCLTAGVAFYPPPSKILTAYAAEVSDLDLPQARPYYTPDTGTARRF